MKLSNGSHADALVYALPDGTVLVIGLPGANNAQIKEIADRKHTAAIKPGQIRFAVSMLPASAQRTA